jgi:hypothetical protein
VLKPVLLIVVQKLILRIQRPKLSDCAYPRWVVGGDCSTLEALAHNMGSNADALGVVCGVEDAAGGLQLSERYQCTSNA